MKLGEYGVEGPNENDWELIQRSWKTLVSAKMCWEGQEGEPPKFVNAPEAEQLQDAFIKICTRFGWDPSTADQILQCIDELGVLKGAA